MRFFRRPRDADEAYALSILCLRISGLFPYRYDKENNKYVISWKSYMITVFHFLLYTYVNITSLIENWKDYSQPMIGQSQLTVFGNLALRLIAILVTFLILQPVLIGNRFMRDLINIYIKILDDMSALGISTDDILQQIFVFSIVFSCIWLLLLVSSLWHSTYFYTYITQKEPSTKFYLVVILSNFYRSMMIFDLITELFGLYAISQRFNKFLANLRDKYREEYEQQQQQQQLELKKLSASISNIEMKNEAWVDLFEFTE